MASPFHRFQVVTAAKRPRPRPRRTYIRHESSPPLRALLPLRLLDPSPHTRRALPIRHPCRHHHRREQEEEEEESFPLEETLVAVTLRPARSRTRSCRLDSGSTLPLGSYPCGGSPKRHGTSLAMVNSSRTFRSHVASRSPHIIIISIITEAEEGRTSHGLIIDRYRSSSRGGTPVPLQIRSSRRALPSKNVRSLDSLPPRPPLLPLPPPPRRRRRPTRCLLASDKERRWADPRACQPRSTVPKQGRHPPPPPPPPSRTTTIACCLKSSSSSPSNDVSQTDSPALEQLNHHPRPRRTSLLARVPKEEVGIGLLLRWLREWRGWEEGSDPEGRCGSGVQ
jgi:hypothetical protein